MSVFNRLITAITTKSAAVPGLFGFFNPTAMPRMSEKEFVKQYRGWVYACIEAIAHPVGQMKLRLEKKVSDGWQEVEDHDAINALRRVNDHMTMFDLLYGTEAYLKLDGNSFWYMVRNGSGKIVEMWPVDPTRMKIVKSESDFVGGYVFLNEKGINIPFKTDEILHMKKFNPLNPYRGMGTVEAAAIQIDIDNYSAEWQRNFFGNSAMPSAVLTANGTLNQEQYDRIRGNWDAKFKGVQNAHKLGILENGMTFTPISPTNRELQFTEGRKNLRDEILAIFRVPKTILGISEDVNFASAQATEYVFGKWVVKPEMDFIVGQLNEFFLPVFNLDPRQYRFNYDDPVPQNVEQQVMVRESGIKNGYLRINEARAEIGMEPVEGGDTIYISSLLAPLPGTDANESDTKPEADAKAIRVAKLKKIHRLLAHKTRKFAVNIRKTAAKKSAYIDQQSSKAFKKYQAHNEELKSMLLTNIKSKGIKPAIRKMADAETKSAGVSDFLKIVFAGFDGWVAAVNGTAQDNMSTVMGEAGADALAEVHVDTSFDLENPRAVAWLTDNALANTTSYAGTLKDDISIAITDGLDNGEGPDEIAADVGSFFDDQGDFRALRLARTETIDAYAQGNLEGYKQSDVVTGKEWLPDDQACEICLGNADDGVIGLDETFSSGDDAPTAHPNCECALQPVVEGDEG